MEEPPKPGIPELMDRLGVSGRQLQNVKLGPGVVGRNSSIAWILEVVMLGGVVAGVWLHSTLIVGGSLLGAILVGLAVTGLNVYFAKQNPSAAILEGAQFVEFHHLQLTASKGEKPTEGGPPVPPPLQIGGADTKSLPEKPEPEQ